MTLASEMRGNKSNELRSQTRYWPVHSPPRRQQIARENARLAMGIPLFSVCRGRRTGSTPPPHQRECERQRSPYRASRSMVSSPFCQRRCCRCGSRWARQRARQPGRPAETRAVRVPSSMSRLTLSILALFFGMFGTLRSRGIPNLITALLISPELSE